MARLRSSWPRIRTPLIIALLLVFPFIDTNAAHINFLVDAGIFIFLALGLNIVVGFAGLLDLGYAAFFAVGSYTYALLASSQFNLHLPFWILLPVAALIAALFGILLGAPTLRLRGDYLAIVTLGFGEIVPQTFLNMSSVTNGPNGISSLDVPTFFGHSFGFSGLPYYLTTLALLVFAVVFARNLRESRIGRAWVAMREDELAAGFMGINLTATKLSAFAIGASFSGIAGVLYAAKLQYVSPDQFQFSVSVFVLSMLVLGGMGNITGVIVGSLVLTTLNTLVLPQLSTIAQHVGIAIDFSNDRLLIYGIILVVMMLVRPEGLLPSRDRKAEFRAARDNAVIASQEHSLGPNIS